MMGSPLKRVTLVSCVSSQLEYASAASELFQGEWFSLCRQYAARHSNEWFLLSAKYGLVAPNVVIEPYPETIRAMSATTRRTWAHRINLNLATVVPRNSYVTLMAGLRVRDVVVPLLDKLQCDINLPLNGMNAAQQILQLRKMNR